MDSESAAHSHFEASRGEKPASPYVSSPLPISASRSKIASTIGKPCVPVTIGGSKVVGSAGTATIIVPPVFPSRVGWSRSAQALRPPAPNASAARPIRQRVEKEDMSDGLREKRKDRSVARLHVGTMPDTLYRRQSHSSFETIVRCRATRSAKSA